MKFFELLVLIFFLLVPEISFALRCGHSLIAIGDSKDEVYDKCGSPESVETHYERIGIKNYASGTQIFPDHHPAHRFPKGRINQSQEQYAEVEIAIEEWIYDFGRSKLRQYLRFENGRLKEIRSHGRGN